MHATKATYCARSFWPGELVIPDLIGYKSLNIFNSYIDRKAVFVVDWAGRLWTVVWAGNGPGPCVWIFETDEFWIGLVWGFQVTEVHFCDKNELNTSSFLIFQGLALRLCFWDAWVTKKNFWSTYLPEMAHNYFRTCTFLILKLHVIKCRSHRFNIIARAIAATVARDLGSDSSLLKQSISGESEMRV